MLNRNRHEVIGHLGDAPQLKYSPSGRPVATFQIATNRRWKDADGKRQEATDWHRIVTWGPRAEFAAKHLRKGSYVSVIGFVQTRSYEKDGTKHYNTETVAQEIDFLEAAPNLDTSPSLQDDAGNEGLADQPPV